MLVFSILVLLHTLLSIIFLAVVLVKCFQMFAFKSLRTNATPVLLLFFGYLGLVSITLLFYCAYLLIYWRPEEIIYRNVSMYLTGLIPWIMLVSNPIFEFALCIERCLLITYPHRYFNYYRTTMAVAVFFIILFTVCLNLWINGFIWLPPTGITQCQYFACITFNLPMRFMTAYKILIAVAEVIAAVVLMYLIKFNTISMTSKGKKKNMVIFAIISSTVICEFGPNILDIIFYSVSGQFSENVIGPYRTTLSSFNIATSAVLYSYVLKPKNTVSNLPIFVTSSTK